MIDEVEQCGVFEIGGTTRMVVSRLPGRKGKYLLIEAQGELMIVARVFGVTEREQDRAEKRILDWAAGREVV